MKYRTTIEKISYQFSVNGAILTFLRIDPAITIDDNKCINKFPVTCFDPSSDFEIAQGDVVELTPTDTGVILKVLAKSTRHRQSIKPEVCPFCGHPLISDGSLSYCLNKECHAQMIQNILLLTSSLGLTFVGSNKRIFDILVSSAVVSTPADLFEIDLDKLYTLEEPAIHAQMFQQYLHSVRGHVTFDQILKGLHIFGMTDDNVNRITDVFNKEGLTLLSVDKLFDKKLFTKYPEVDWLPWELFIVMETNRKQLVRLCNILHL